VKKSKTLLTDFRDLEENPRHNRKAPFLRNAILLIFPMVWRIKLFGKTTDIHNFVSRSD
jgi:hypothetical protein